MEEEQKKNDVDLNFEDSLLGSMGLYDITVPKRLKAIAIKEMIKDESLKRKKELAKMWIKKVNKLSGLNDNCSFCKKNKLRITDIIG